MCKMALFISDRNISTNMDKILWESWKDMNRDGYGYYAIRANQLGKPSTWLVHRTKKINKQFPNFNPKQLFLLHCRSATQGKGQHPFSSEDKRLMLVHNGNIHNYEQLEVKLRSQGHQFKTDVDSEVLLHAYEELCNHRHEEMFKKQTVVDFIAYLNDHEVNGWINFILLDVVTQKWLAFCDGSLTLARPIFDPQWILFASNVYKLDEMHILKNDMSSGEYVLGQGMKINLFDKTETLKARQWPTTNYPTTTYYDSTKGNRGLLIDHNINHYQKQVYFYSCNLNCCRLLEPIIDVKCWTCQKSIRMSKHYVKGRMPFCNAECYARFEKVLEDIDKDGPNHERDCECNLCTGLQMCKKCKEVMTGDKSGICITCRDTDHRPIKNKSHKNDDYDYPFNRKDAYFQGYGYY